MGDSPALRWDFQANKLLNDVSKWEQDINQIIQHSQSCLSEMEPSDGVKFADITGSKKIAKLFSEKFDSNIDGVFNNMDGYNNIDGAKHAQAFQDCAKQVDYSTGELGKFIDILR